MPMKLYWVMKQLQTREHPVWDFLRRSWAERRVAMPAEWDRLTGGNGYHPNWAFQANIWPQFTSFSSSIQFNLSSNPPNIKPPKSLHNKKTSSHPSNIPTKTWTKRQTWSLPGQFADILASSSSIKIHSVYSMLSATNLLLPFHNTKISSHQQYYSYHKISYHMRCMLAELVGNPYIRVRGSGAQLLSMSIVGPLFEMKPVIRITGI